MNTKENVLCEERKEKEKSGGECWTSTNSVEFREGGPLRVLPASTSESERERRRHDDQAWQVGSGGVSWAATNERRWLCDSFCVKCVK